MVFCIVLGIVSTQIYAENKIRFGVKGGVNASTTSVSLSEYAPGTYFKITPNINTMQDSMQVC